TTQLRTLSRLGAIESMGDNDLSYRRCATHSSSILTNASFHQSLGSNSFSFWRTE
ncbi:hypothetical protein LOAG_16186, partial [Loa loa]